MAQDKNIQMPISEKLLDALKPALRRIAVTKLKMRVLKNLKDSTREQPGGK